MIAYAPPRWPVRGKMAASQPMIAIVGSRNAYSAGIKFAERWPDLGWSFRFRLLPALLARHRCRCPSCERQDAVRPALACRPGCNLSAECSTRDAIMSDGALVTAKCPLALSAPAPRLFLSPPAPQPPYFGMSVRVAVVVIAA